MHVAALMLAERSDQKWNSVDVSGVPKFIFNVPAFPAQLVLPVVAVLWSEPGEDTHADIQVLCMTPDSEILGGQRHQWDWLEQQGILTKYHVFTHGLEVIVDDPGLYYVGLGGEMLGDESTHVPFVVTGGSEVPLGADDLLDPFAGSS